METKDEIRGKFSIHLYCEFWLSFSEEEKSDTVNKKEPHCLFCKKDGSEEHRRVVYNLNSQFITTEDLSPSDKIICPAHCCFTAKSVENFYNHLAEYPSHSQNLRKNTVLVLNSKTSSTDSVSCSK